MSNQNLKEGILLKQEVLDKIQAKSYNWVGFALYHLRRLPTGEYTGEDIRYEILKHIEEPKNSHVWGALINTALRRGYITKTGKIGQMKTPSSHAHNTPIFYLEKLV